MDQLNHYRDIITDLLAEYASWKGGDDVHHEIIIDQTRNHFALIQFGWDGNRRIHHVMLHLDIRDDKIWIQHDSTDRPIAEALLRSGIAPSHIVLAFHPKDIRPLTAFAPG